MDTKKLFDEEVEKCGDQSMTVEERRAAYAYFLRGWHLKSAECSELRSLERSYTHQLGEMARLSDIVCGEVLSYSNTDLFPENVMNAANEIMQYVEAVRPDESEKKTEWAMHIIGPDDVIPCRGEFDALRKANQHNIAFAKLMADDPSPNDPYCVAVAELV